jgi:hypothetical protein
LPLDESTPNLVYSCQPPPRHGAGTATVWSGTVEEIAL